jgi:hypothetical protein
MGMNIPLKRLKKPLEHASSFNSSGIPVRFGRIRFTG